MGGSVYPQYTHHSSPAMSPSAGGSGGPLPGPGSSGPMTVAANAEMLSALAQLLSVSPMPNNTGAAAAAASAPAPSSTHANPPLADTPSLQQLMSMLAMQQAAAPLSQPSSQSGPARPFGQPPTNYSSFNSNAPSYSYYDTNQSLNGQNPGGV